MAIRRRQSRVQLDNGKWAFIDHDGNVVSKEYKDAWSYAEGKAMVQLDNDKYAFIDHDGNIIPFKNSENSEVEKKFRLDLNFLFVILNMIQMIHRLGSPFGLLLRWNRNSFGCNCALDKTGSASKCYVVIYQVLCNIKHLPFLSARKSGKCCGEEESLRAIAIRDSTAVLHPYRGN